MGTEGFPEMPGDLQGPFLVPRKGYLCWKEDGGAKNVGSPASSPVLSPAPHAIDSQDDEVRGSGWENLLVASSGRGQASYV